jgi:hypothetical protein
MNDAVYAITELNKRFQERLILDNPRFVDHYLKFELRFLIPFRARGIEEQFIACFERYKAY